jgi:hypothetical protein
MHLLRLDSQAEQYYILDILKSENNWSFIDEITLIDGTREGAPLNTWYSAGSGKTMDFNIKWGTAQPNNFSEENCLMIYRDFNMQEFNIHDFPCEPMFPYKFICEMADDTFDFDVRVDA